MKVRGKVFVSLVGGIGILAAVPFALARTTFCVGNFSQSTFDNVVVPAGSSCQLDSFNLVRGNIKVKEGATLIICPDNEVDGHIDAKEATTVFISDQTISLCDSQPPKALGITIGGNIDIKKTQSFTLIGNPFGVTSVDGNVSAKDSENVAIISFDGIGGNVEAKNNVNVDISGNTIAGNLKIRGTTGSCVGDGTNNSVGGNVDACP